MWMPLWICLQEKAHVAGEVYQRRRKMECERGVFLWGESKVEEWSCSQQRQREGEYSARQQTAGCCVVCGGYERDLIMAGNIKDN